MIWAQPGGMRGALCEKEMQDLLAPHRPYDAAYADVARVMTRQGATTCDLANHFDVSISSVHVWAAVHPEFCAALRIGGAECDDRVEKMLYERAVGYTFDSDKALVVDKAIVHETVREHVPPDIQAIRLWLKNRRPEDWHDNRVIEFGGQVRVTAASIAELRDADLDELQRQYSETLDLVAEVQPVAEAEADRD